VLYDADDHSRFRTPRICRRCTQGKFEEVVLCTQLERRAPGAVLFAGLVRSQEHEIPVVLLRHVKLLRAFDATGHSYYFLMGYNRDVAPRTTRHRRHVGTVGARFKFDREAR
jgi:hypothetical protein